MSSNCKANHTYYLLLITYYLIANHTYYLLPVTYYLKYYLLPKNEARECPPLERLISCFLLLALLLLTF